MSHGPRGGTMQFPHHVDRHYIYHGPFLRTGSPLHELLSAAVSAVAPISTMFVTAAPTRTEAERLREATVVRKSLRLAHLHTVSDPDRLCECASVRARSRCGLSAHGPSLNPSHATPPLNEFVHCGAESSRGVMQARGHAMHCTDVISVAVVWRLLSCRWMACTTQSNVRPCMPAILAVSRSPPSRHATNLHRRVPKSSGSCG